ncbi:MAG: cation:proton antiporter [Thermoplasmata archaeon]|nr:cation:proton antiporter [Thermoplasmata archaeon]
MIEDTFLVVSGFLVLYILGASIRLAAGPTAPDRAVALDTINTLVVALMIALGVAYYEVIFIDIAIVYALLSFITTLYIARYLEERNVGGEAAGETTGTEGGA